VKGIAILITPEEFTTMLVDVIEENHLRLHQHLIEVEEVHLQEGHHHPRREGEDHEVALQGETIGDVLVDQDLDHEKRMEEVVRGIENVEVVGVHLLEIDIIIIIKGHHLLRLVRQKEEPFRNSFSKDCQSRKKTWKESHLKNRKC